jgi:SAM-dependent methyltransferase
MATMSRGLQPGLACPTCRVHLSMRGATVLCPHCENEWPIVDGLPIFSEAEHYWGEVPQPLLQHLLERGRAVGWRPAVEELLRPKYASIARYIQDPCRADWRFLLPDTSAWTVLDVGAGWGSISLLLSPACQSVVALENVRERAQFIQLRALQDGAANVNVVCADMLAPPLPEGSCHLVVMNGVVEWLGLADTARDPRQVQVSVLDSARRLLRPGGYLYVGIENRFGYPLFLGLRDHSGERFTSLMPRRVATWYLRRLRRAGYRERRRTGSSLEQYRTYTYSARGYRKLLADAGFASCQLYRVLPTYNRPYAIAPLESGRLIHYYTSRVLTPTSLRQRLVAAGEGLLSALRLDRAFSQSFLIVARR